MNWKFWKRKQPLTTQRAAVALHAVVGRCVCTHSRKVQHLGEWEVCPLVGGNHTSFMLERCYDCGKICGFPDSNLEIALQYGTDETRAKLNIIIIINTPNAGGEGRP